MNSLDFFEKYYGQKGTQYFSASLISFFESTIRHRLSFDCEILEIGAGSYSLFEEIKDFKAHVRAIDFSKKAIKKAPKSAVHYELADVTISTFFPDDHYDFVFDAHCVNCLTSKEERQKAFENIYRALKVNALLACELMVRPSHGPSVQIPFKVVQTALEWEQEFISNGFKIVYFMIVKESHFGAMVEGREVNCDVLRVIAQK
ncbi:MAG: class I SAM-dependent methyltransferase [Bacteriovorax sp.]|nr:class I SAM-dependent methyltransferase [Bacteriovorax sp.]